MALPAQTEPDFLLPNHRGPWTLEDVLALPEDPSQRVELVDGALIVSPMGTFRHQNLLFDIAFALRVAAPPELQATVEVNVGLSDRRLLIPDFSVLRRTGFDGLIVPVEDVVLVGEVVSRSSRVHDKVFKRTLYAEAGVPFYLLIDPSGRTVDATLYKLVDGEYQENARSLNGKLTVDKPFPVELDLQTG
jgi:Uma2 family endonuclease